MNLGAAWIYGAGPENPIRQLADKLNLTLIITPVYYIVAVNLGAAWIYGAGPENPIRQLADKLNLTLIITPYLYIIL